MQTVFNPKQLLHTPQSELSDGGLVSAVEIPRRAEVILECVKQLSLGDIIYSEIGDLTHIKDVHCSKYLEFFSKYLESVTRVGSKWRGVPVCLASEGNANR